MPSLQKVYESKKETGNRIVTLAHEKNCVFGAMIFHSSPKGKTGPNIVIQYKSALQNLQSSQETKRMFVELFFRQTHTKKYLSQDPGAPIRVLSLLCRLQVS